MKKLFLFSLIFLFFFTGCGAFDFFEELFRKDPPPETTHTPIELPKPEPYPVTIDGVIIEKSPEKIISLSPALTEIMFEFSEGDRLIAVSEYCDFPRELTLMHRLTAIRGSIGLDLQAIMALSPDLLLLTSPISEKDRRDLEQEGIPALVLPSPRNLEEFKQIYRLIGIILHGGFIGADEGESVFAAITHACNNPEAVNIGDFIYITENLLVATGDTLESSVLSCFGNNLAKDSSDYVFDKRDLLENPPDVILLSNAYSLSDLQSDEIYSQLDAVVLERVIPVNNLYFERPSSRIITLITEMQVKYKDLRM